MGIGPTTGIAARPHRMTWQNPGPPVPDGDGGYSQSWLDLAPLTTSVEIKPATARDLEKIAAGTVLATATHVVTGPYHPQITTKSRGLYNGRIFTVTGLASPEESNVETVALCVEIVP